MYVHVCLVNCCHSLCGVFPLSCVYIQVSADRNSIAVEERRLKVISSLLLIILCVPFFSLSSMFPAPSLTPCCPNLRYFLSLSLSCLQCCDVLITFPVLSPLLLSLPLPPSSSLSLPPSPPPSLLQFHLHNGWCYVGSPVMGYLDKVSPSSGDRKSVV